jgi:L-ribulose-5-phosphate 3-epimerase
MLDTENRVMTHQVGIMQGRLLPPYEGRFQAFPAARWREEFSRAREAGLSCIEWIYEEPHEAENPVASDVGLAAVRSAAAQTGVLVRSICADYYMTQPLVRDGSGIDRTAQDHLAWLIGRAQQLGVSYLVLPFVDASSIRTASGREALVELLGQMLPRAAAAGIELHLETDFPPEIFAGVLRAVGHPSLRCTYDIGNSASLGFDPDEEFDHLAPFLGSVHVKDRIRGGGTVPLGTGSADFPRVFHRILTAGFRRWFILQAAREEPGREVAWSAANRCFVEAQLAALVGA